jgi:G3E family GTPase
LQEEAVNAAHHHHHSHDVNRHDASIRAFTLTHDKPIDADAMQMFLDLLRSAHGPQLLRMKGIVQTTENPDQPVVIHAVQHIFHPPATLEKWPDEDHRTRIVIITRDLDEGFVQRLFDAFTGRIAPDTPDRQALEHNPLAVPGFPGPKLR